MLKKTLLLSSALASAALMSTASLAELKVSGLQEWEYSTANAKNTSTNNKLVGSNTELNFSGGGSLGGSNSYTMNYLFSNGSTDTVQANFKVSGIDIEVGQNNSIAVEDVKAIVPFVNKRVNDIGGKNTISYDVTDLSSGTASIGANFPVASLGAISVGYNPNMANPLTLSTDAGIAGGSVSTGSAYSASFKGSLGVSGLTVGVGFLEGNNAVSANDDVQSLTYGAAYNFGSVSVGYQRIENTADAVKSSSSETFVDNYGIAFAATDSITLGLYRSDSEKEAEGVKGIEMETTVLQIGYKLGAAKLSYDYVSSDNYGHSATNDLELHKIQVSLAF